MLTNFPICRFLANNLLNLLRTAICYYPLKIEKNYDIFTVKAQKYICMSLFSQLLFEKRKNVAIDARNCGIIVAKTILLLQYPPSTLPVSGIIDQVM